LGATTATGNWLGGAGATTTAGASTTALGSTTAVGTTPYGGSTTAPGTTVFGSSTYALSTTPRIIFLDMHKTSSDHRVVAHASQRLRGVRNTHPAPVVQHDHENHNRVGHTLVMPDVTPSRKTPTLIQNQFHEHEGKFHEQEERCDCPCAASQDSSYGTYFAQLPPLPALSLNVPAGSQEFGNMDFNFPTMSPVLRF